MGCARTGISRARAGAGVGGRRSERKHIQRWEAGVLSKGEFFFGFF
jgi:hypothetical protein